MLYIYIHVFIYTIRYIFVLSKLDIVGWLLKCVGQHMIYLTRPPSNSSSLWKITFLE